MSPRQHMQSLNPGSRIALLHTLPWAVQLSLHPAQFSFVLRGLSQPLYGPRSQSAQSPCQYGNKRCHSGTPSGPSHAFTQRPLSQRENSRWRPGFDALKHRWRQAPQLYGSDLRFTSQPSAGLRLQSLYPLRQPVQSSYPGGQPKMAHRSATQVAWACGRSHLTSQLPQ